METIGVSVENLYRKPTSIGSLSKTEATAQRCSWETVFWKYAADLQENTHVEVRFQWSCLHVLVVY